MSVRLGGYTRRPKEISSLPLRVKLAVTALIVLVHGGLAYGWVAMDRKAAADDAPTEPREYVKYYDIGTFGPAGELRTLEEVAPTRASAPIGT